MSVMIDIEKAIQNGNALRAARIKADADKAENDRVEAAAAKHRAGRMRLPPANIE